jgi:hypothetical protein
MIHRPADGAIATNNRLSATIAFIVSYLYIETEPRAENEYEIVKALCKNDAMMLDGSQLRMRAQAVLPPSSPR